MNNFIWQHIKFEDGSNPYICMTEDNFNRMKEKYNLINIKDTFWLAKSEEQKINLFDCDEWDEEDGEEIHEILIHGYASISADISMYDFVNEFLKWIESKGYYFDGGFRDCTAEERDDDNY